MFMAAVAPRISNACVARSAVIARRAQHELHDVHRALRFASAVRTTVRTSWPRAADTNAAACPATSAGLRHDAHVAGGALHLRAVQSARRGLAAPLRARVAAARLVPARLSADAESARELGAWLHAQALHDSDDCSQHLVSDRRATVGASGNASTSHSSSRWAGVSLRRALTPRTLLAAMSCGSATFVVYCNRN